MDTQEMLEVPGASRARTSAAGGRDAEAARRSAREDLERVTRMVAAVDRFHEAAAEMDEARSRIESATAVRAEALSEMRSSGLSVPRISELTGMSASRIQTILAG